VIGDDEELSGQTKYAKEIAEQLEPAGNIARPVLGHITYIRAEK
jgi:hypothetical protein